MKVICINNKPIVKPGCITNGIAPELKEGKSYEVEKEHRDAAGRFGYKLVGITNDRNKWGAYLSERFIPLSEIDETVNQRELQTCH